MTVPAPDQATSGFPAVRLAVLLCCRIAEPLAVTSIVPYALFMIKDAEPDLSDIQAASFLTVFYAAFALAQFATNLFWGRVSDRVGRKPVMLCGLAAVAVGSLGFGFARTRAAMVMFRLIPGFLSGNVVIVRTVIGDMVKSPRDKARAFAWNQTVFQAASVLGPVLGGYLARPCHQWPSMCEGGGNWFLAKYPYAAPNLVISLISAISFVLVLFFIQETLERPSRQATSECESNETSPLLRNTNDGPHVDVKPPSLKDAMTPNVVHVILNYAIMSAHAICFDQMFPALLSAEPVESSLPFRLHGGLGMGSDKVATFMSAAGILSITLMIVVFPPADEKFGTLRCLRGSMFVYPITYLVLPYVVVLSPLPRWLQDLAVSAILFSKTLAAVFSFNDSAILLSTEAPSPNTLGLVNGAAQTAAAGARAAGPSLMGLCISLGGKLGYEALGWTFLAVIAAVGTVQVFYLGSSSETGETAQAE